MDHEFNLDELVLYRNQIYQVVSYNECVDGLYVYTLSDSEHGDICFRDVPEEDIDHLGGKKCKRLNVSYKEDLKCIFYNMKHTLNSIMYQA